MSGPTFQKSGTANVGLYDQRLALEWIQKYIHLFGGDSDRVTVMGESAGAGSIMHHITSYGGSKGTGQLPFQQAVLQSASIHNPVQSKLLEEQVFQSFLAAANVSTLDEARLLPSETLQLANKKIIYPAAFGLYVFRKCPPSFSGLSLTESEPTVDGTYVTNILGVSLLDGQFDPTISLISAHNSNEGFVFTDPAATNSSALETYMQIYFPTADPSIISYIYNTLYPPIYDGSQPYTTPFDRLDLLISEMMIACNSRYISTAKGNDTYNYMFSVPPGHHRGDIPYTFWDANSTTNDPVANVTTAFDMQRYITAFAATGDPNAFQKQTGLPTFPKYESEANVVNFNLTFVDVVVDPMKNSRYVFLSGSKLLGWKLLLIFLYLLDVIGGSKVYIYKDKHVRCEST
jgi:cholinesterase